MKARDSNKSTKNKNKNEMILYTTATTKIQNKHANIKQF